MTLESALVIDPLTPSMQDLMVTPFTRMEHSGSKPRGFEKGDWSRGLELNKTGGKASEALQVSTETIYKEDRSLASCGLLPSLQETAEGSQLSSAQHPQQVHLSTSSPTAKIGK